MYVNICTLLYIYCMMTTTVYVQRSWPYVRPLKPWLVVSRYLSRTSLTNDQRRTANDSFLFLVRVI